MVYTEFEGINSFLVGSASILLENGVQRTTRGFSCQELPNPFMFRINNPTARWINIPERKWNLTFAYAEALWFASGRNDLKMIGCYLKNMKNFSDDGKYVSGSYGPRLRTFSGICDDYKNSTLIHDDQSNISTGLVDQFLFVEKCFQYDKNTRQAIINIGDPPKDCFNKSGELKLSKDFPCTRALHFIKKANQDKLDLIVYMRSNDFLWGASATNIFNFTFIQEYLSQILGLEIGDYYQLVSNFHYYEKFKQQIEQLADITTTKDDGFLYKKSFQTLTEFDKLLFELSTYEGDLRAGKTVKLVDLGDDFFNDWFKVFYKFHTKEKVIFKNNLLNELLNK